MKKSVLCLLMFFLTLLLVMASEDQKIIQGLNGKKMDIVLKGKLVKMTSGPIHKVYQNAHEVVLIIYKSRWSRGFYVNQPFFGANNRSISLKFVRFDQSEVTHYDAKHKYNVQGGKMAFASNYVRGVERVEVSFPKIYATKNTLSICIFEEPWLMDLKFIIFFSIIMIAVTGFISFKML